MIFFSTLMKDSDPFGSLFLHEFGVQARRTFEDKNPDRSKVWSVGRDNYINRTTFEQVFYSN